MQEKLLCLHAPGPQFDPAKGAEGLPSRILILPWGNNATTQGPVVCNETTMKLLTSENAKRGWDRPVLDFEHNSEPTSPTYRGEPAKIAGHGALHAVRGEGVYMLMANWTAEGKDNGGGGHYPDLSPVVKVNERNEVIAIKSAALCRHGATPGLMFLSAAVPAHTSKSHSLTHSKSLLLNTMDTPPQSADELLALLRGILKLPAEATAAEVLEAFNGMLATKTDEVKKLSADNTDLKALSASVQSLTATIQAQGETIKLLSSSHETSERGNVLAQATREGKQVPKALAEKLDIANLKLLCAELPVTVPMNQRPEAVLLSAQTQPAPAEMAAIDKLTGVSDDDVKKYNA